MDFLTTTGRRITAATRQAADAIAADYGMGTVAGLAPKKTRPGREIRYGVWDDMSQAWAVGPCSLPEAVRRRGEGCDALVMRYGGEYNPRPLSRAETSEVLGLMEDE